MSLITLNKIKNAVAARPDELAAARAQGRKVVSWLGYNVPEEIIHALGLIPIRIGSGSDDRTVDLGSRYISSKNCVLTRQTVGIFAEGTNPYIKNTDLVAIDATCIQMFRVGEVIQYFFKAKVLGLGVPHNSFHPEAGSYFFHEVQEFATKLEEFAGTKLEEKRFADSIALFDGIRKKIQALYQFQATESPLITWHQAYDVVQAGYYLDREQYSALLGELLSELKVKQGDPIVGIKDGEVRILIAGSSIPPGDNKLIELIESLGGRIIGDDLWTGFVPSLGVEIKEPTIAALAHAYLNRVPHGALPYLDLKTDRRLENLRKQVAHFKAKGVIYHTLRFCDPYSFKAGETKDVLKEAGIPLLEIHTEYAGSDFEAIRTRVEAFIEMLRNQEVRSDARERQSSAATKVDRIAKSKTAELIA